jgi:hypothetical protein
MKKNLITKVRVAITAMAVIFLLHPAQAQEESTENEFEAANKKDRIGFSVSFGSRFNNVSSSFDAINEMNLSSQGGSVGVTWGNRIVETKLTAGYYYSGAKVPHTIEVIELESSVRFYPLSALFKKEYKVAPYFTGGVSRSYHKLFGFYGRPESGPVNYSVSTEPYLGSMTTYFGSVGTGLEVNAFNHADFVKLFAEVNYLRPFTQTSTDLFKSTALSNQVNINVGVSFGINRFNNN